jgi:uncharacterized protein YwgA
MIRDTSIEVYHEIEANGLLSKKRLEVYKILYESGPLTGAQVSRMHGNIYGANTVSETVRNRITELFDMGVVQEVSKGPCPITEREVIFWDVTKNLPVKVKRQTFKERKKEVMGEIITLGEKIPMGYKQDLRDIYHKLKDL